MLSFLFSYERNCCCTGKGVCSCWWDVEDDDGDRGLSLSVSSLSSCITHDIYLSLSCMSPLMSFPVLAAEKHEH